MQRTLLTLVSACGLTCVLSACPSPPAPSSDAGATSASAAQAPVPTGAGSVMAPPAVASAVGAVLDDWHDAAARADEARYFSHFTADAVFMGTDASERWDVPAFRAYARAPFARGKAWSFRSTRRAVMTDAGGNLAWFDEDLATAGLGPARGSGVMRRESDGRWRIAHYNLTITVPNDRFDEVKALLASPPPPRDAGAGVGPGDGGSAPPGAGGPPPKKPFNAGF